MSVCFWRKAYIAMNFPLRTAFLLSIHFIRLCFHCHLSWGIFWFPLWVHNWMIGFFGNILFRFHMFVLFPFFFLQLISNFIWLWLEKMLALISIQLNLLRLILWHQMWFTLENFSCVLKKNMYLEVVSCRNQLSPNGLLCHFGSLLHYWFYFWNICPLVSVDS